MENLALIESFSEFKDDKFIDRVTLMAILEEVFRGALKRKFGSDDNFDNRSICSGSWVIQRTAIPKAWQY